MIVEVYGGGFTRGGVGKFRRGELVVMREDGVYDDEDEGVEGVVWEVRRWGLKVGVRKGLEGSERVLKGGRWFLEGGMSVVGFERCKEVLEGVGGVGVLEGVRKGVVEGFGVGGLRLGLGKVEGVDLREVRKVLGVLEGGLNEGQRRVVEEALRRRVCLVQGPPGTGKTTTVSWIVTCATMMGKKVLVTAFSNVAADNLVEAIVKARNGDRGVVRIGRAATVKEELWPFTLDARVDAVMKRSSNKVLETKDTNSKKSKTKGRNGKATNTDALYYELLEKTRTRIVRQADIIVATCIGSGSEALADVEFPVVVIDEACQATEPSALVSTSSKTSQLILVGDQFQLPPTVLSGYDSPLYTSLFERLIAEGMTPLLLNRQYRMHPMIANFPSKQFYSGKLLSDDITKSRVLPCNLDPLLTSNPVLFLNCNGGEEQVDKKVGEKMLEQNAVHQYSFANPQEAELVLRIVELLSVGFQPQDIGIISPYSLQVRVISELLRTSIERGDEVEVHTVDGFQGREKAVIVFSAVRCNKEGKVGFLSDWRRLNVAITRAQMKLIVIGNAGTLKSDKVWRAWLRWLRNQGCFKDATESNLTD